MVVIAHVRHGNGRMGDARRRARQTWNMSSASMMTKAAIDETAPLPLSRTAQDLPTHDYGKQGHSARLFRGPLPPSATSTFMVVPSP